MAGILIWLWIMGVLVGFWVLSTEVTDLAPWFGGTVVAVIAIIIWPLWVIPFLIWQSLQPS